MADVLFISQEFLRTNSIINDNTDWELIQPTIISCQDIYLEQILGTVLFEDLKTKIAADATLSTHSNDLILVRDYIAKVLLWYVQMQSMPTFKYRFMNKGIMVRSGNDSQPIPLDELKQEMDRLRIIAEAYAERLTKYLTHHVDLYPKYREYLLEGKLPLNSNYTTGIDLEDYRYTVPHSNDSDI